MTPGSCADSPRPASTCLKQGELPPLPITVYDYEDYAKALRLMTSGKHQGKLVLRAPPAGVHPQFPIVDRRPLLDPDATYLVSGGLGGFGLCLLPYLVSVGARHLTLMDRDPERRRSADWLRESNSHFNTWPDECEIDIVAGDVAVAEDVERCVAGLRRPLKGVFHLAGVLDDRLLDTMSRESVETVFAPKATGALNLHRATAGHPLDLFVMASSTASTFGNPGQINYSAASAYLDGLAVVAPQAGFASAVLQHCGGRRGRHGLAKPSCAAHAEDGRHAPGQHSICNHQPRLCSAQTVRQPPPGDRAVQAGSVDRRLCGLHAHRSPDEQPRCVPGSFRRPAHARNRDDADCREGRRAMRPR